MYQYSADNGATWNDITQGQMEERLSKHFDNVSIVLDILHGSYTVRIDGCIYRYHEQPRYAHKERYTHNKR